MQINQLRGSYFTYAERSGVALGNINDRLGPGSYSLRCREKEKASQDMFTSMPRKYNWKCFGKRCLDVGQTHKLTLVITNLWSESFAFSPDFNDPCSNMEPFSFGSIYRWT